MRWRVLGKKSFGGARRAQTGLPYRGALTMKDVKKATILTSLAKAGTHAGKAASGGKGGKAT